MDVDSIKITTRAMTPDERRNFLDLVATGYTVQDATTKVGCTAAMYEHTRNKDKDFDAAISEAIRCRGPVPIRKLRAFDTLIDRKETMFKLRHQYRVDEAVGEAIIDARKDLASDDDKARLQARKDLVKIFHTRMSTHDRNEHHNVNHSIDFRQNFDADAGNIALLLEKTSANVQKLLEQQGKVKREREALAAPMVDVEFTPVEEKVRADE